MNKLKIFFKIFYVLSFASICIFSVLFVLCFFFTHLYVFIKIFYAARPPFEFQGRILR